MLNTFPGLLTYGFFAPTLLRIVAAGVIAYLAYTLYKHRGQRLPLLGNVPWVFWAALIVEAGVVLSLFFGYRTQIGAILGAVIALKQWFWGKQYPIVFPLSRTASLLLLAICLSLLVSGAGALAMDLPL